MIIKNALRLCLTFVGLLFVASAHGESQIIVSSDIAGNKIKRSLGVGEIVPVTLYVQSDGNAPVLGMSLDLSCASEAVRIRGVAFNPVFSVVLGRAGEPTLPASHFRTVRAQAARQVDRQLGTGAPTWFARVELEVVGGTAFESALAVRARGVLLGAPAVTTTVLGTSCANNAPATGRIAIASGTNNTAAAGAESAVLSDSVASHEPDWTEEQSSVAFEVRPPGGGKPVTTPAPYTTYELWYETPCQRVNELVLTVGAASPGAGLTDARPASDGPWAGVEAFAFATAGSDGGSVAGRDGMAVPATHWVDGFWFDGKGYGGPQGHLCNFTTGSPGKLRFELFMDWTDPGTRQCVWMRSVADYVVDGAPTPGTGVASETVDGSGTAGGDTPVGGN